MRLFGRGVFILAACVMVIGAAVPHGQARAAPYAAIVVDMRSGEVLHSRNADNRQHPASLTKMMTLYLTFEAVRRGQLGLDQKVRVSRHAARQPASKLYLKAGERVSIRHLIRATAIKSANDAAMVLAEAISGSQAAFGKLMTQKARELGMTNSTFRNPHGLTQKGHLSTARDMALLARHLYFDFPQYYNVFGKRSHVAAGRRIWTTNRLLSTYRGAEGMKTGYTRAAGYNLVAAASRGSKRVVAVVMGGRSSRQRNAKVAELLDLGFRKAPVRTAVIKPSVARTLVAKAPLPRAKPGVPATGLAAIGAALSSPAVAATRPSTSRYAPLYAERPRRRGGAGTQIASLAQVEKAGLPVPEEKPSWSVEVGTYDDHAEAVALLTSVALGDLDMLADSSPEIRELDGKSGKFYRVSFKGLDQGAASSACRKLVSTGERCQTVAPAD